MKKRTTLLVLFFTLFLGTMANAQSESIYIHDLYIVESGNISSSERVQINKTVKNIKEYFKATLKGDYDVLPKTLENMSATTLQDVDINYRNDADYVVFGTAAYDEDIEYLSVFVYLYEILDNGYLKAVDKYISEGAVSEWNARESRLKKIDEILRNIFPDLKANQIYEDKKEESKVKPNIKVDKEKPIKKPKPKRTPSSIKINIPVAGTITAGALMGGTGIYLRSKALKLYKDYDRAVADDISDDMLDIKLEDARKPNRSAHIMGVGGILIVGAGTYMWIRQKNKDTVTHFQRVKITPDMEYNINSNQNTIHAKITYTF